MAKQGFNWGGMIAPVAGAITSALGIGEKRQDKRQVEQQKKLNEVQEASNRRMMESQKAMDLKMWQDTNYSAQVAEAKKAGMSISALYGGSGASGATTGGSGAGVGGAQASDATSAQATATQQGMAIAQMGLMNAQKENIEADTANKQANTEKTAGADTEQTKANTALTNFQATITKLESQMKTATYQEGVEKIVAESNKAMEEMAIMANNRQISDATLKDAINKIQAEAIGATLTNKLIRSNVAVNEAQITKIANEIQQKWRELELQGQGNNINEANNKRIVEAIIESAWVGAGAQVAGDIIGVLTKTKLPKGSQELKRTVTDDGKIHTTHTRRTNEY